MHYYTSSSLAGSWECSKDSQRIIITVSVFETIYKSVYYVRRPSYHSILRPILHDRLCSTNNSSTRLRTPGGMFCLLFYSFSLSKQKVTFFFLL
jgi:hypothetical protein